ncbi:MAG: DUF2207 domain-containing protein [Phycisphaerae bacterium]|nr:DUF2207 domain-containing protein [Phycisphaerae bacterium]
MRLGLAVRGCLSVLLAFTAAASGPATAQAQRTGERILAYHSDIRVHADGWITVRETIQVRSEAKEIRRGIYRDFPVRYAGRDRSRVIVPFQVVSVRRDGKREGFHTESHGKYQRVYMGRKGVFLRPGVYKYELTYRAGRMLGYFKGHDELYFNVTGNEWGFPIDAAAARVTLPKGVPAGKIRPEAYTGKKGKKGRAYRAAVDSSGRALFAATGPLSKGEGLTIVVTWPKGHVAEPALVQKIGYLLSDSGPVLAALLGLVVVGLYYLVVWSRVGRDPPKGVIIPLFEPPTGLCPASVRYILRMGFDRACFAASVIGLAVKDRLTIQEDDGGYTLVKKDGGDESSLTGGEKGALQQLFAGEGEIELDNANHARFRGATNGLKKVLAGQHKGKHFHANLKYFIPGVILSVLTIAAVGLISLVTERNPVVLFLCVWLSGWSVGCFLLVRQAILAWKKAGQAKGLGKVGKSGGAIGATIGAVMFCGAEVVVLGILAYMASIWLLPVLVLLGLANVRFQFLLKRPTVVGRRIMDAIEGFRMYLEVAERDTLSASRGPDKTPELFERYLPYAIALDVESQWAEKFADVLERAAAAPGGYQPAWYHGAAWGALGASSFASSFSGSFAGALSSASMAPGSSGGGGGSSGGGGGGGGGGGW